MILPIAIVLLGLIGSISTQYTSTYAVQLTTSSQSYGRGAASSVYYYQAFELRVSVAGTYTFTSSGSVSFDPHGYIYQGNFYPNYSQYNLVTENDDTSSRDFRLTATLRSDLRYILIAAAHGERSVGSFSVTASGPGPVSMVPIIINT